MNELLRRLLFLPPQASSVARELDTLHYVVISTTMFGAFAVAGVAGYFILRYRRSAGRATFGLEQDGYRMPGGVPYWVEFGGIGLLLILFVTFWVIGFRQFVHLESAPANAIQIHVTGKQWMWTFAYPNGAGSKGVLYVPTHRPVQLTLASRDVIHSFFIPEFRVKKDAVPGYATSMWFEAQVPGVYQILCTEYCGEGHSTMRGQVVALSEQEYLDRLARLPRLTLAGPDYDEPAVVGRLQGQAVTLAEMGERVAVAHGCMRCHTVDGTPHLGPTWAFVFGSEVPLVTGESVLADAAYITESIMDPMLKIRSGFEPIMPAYQGLLSVAEVGALVEYMRALSRVPLRPSPAPYPPLGTDSRATPAPDAIPGGEE